MRFFYHCWAIYKFIEIISLKAPENCSDSFWAYNFSICLWENPKLLISMISGFGDVSLAPKTNCFYLSRPQDAWRNPRKWQRLPNHTSYKFQNIGNFKTFETNCKDGHRKAPTIRLINSWTSWIWNQYLQKAKSLFCKSEPISFQNIEDFWVIAT